MQARVGGPGEMLKGGKQSIQVRSVRLDRPELNLARRARWHVERQRPPRPNLESPGSFRRRR